MEEHLFDRLIVKIMALSKPDAITPGEVYGLVSELSAAVQEERASRSARLTKLEAEKQALLKSQASLKAQVAKLQGRPATKEIQQLKSYNGTLKRDLALMGQEATRLETELANCRTMLVSHEPSSNHGSRLLLSGSADEERAGRPVVNLGARLTTPAPAFTRGPKQGPATSTMHPLASTLKSTADEGQGHPTVKLEDRLHDRSVLATDHRVTSSTPSTVDKSRDPRLPSKAPAAVEHTLTPAGSKRPFSEHTKDSPAKKIKMEPSINPQSPRIPTSFDWKLTAIADLNA